MAKVKGQETAREVAFTFTNAGTAAANTITKIESSVSLEEKVAMRIHSIEYHLATPSGWGNFTTSGDRLFFGLTFLSTIPTGGFQSSSPGLIDFNQIYRLDFGTAAAGNLFKDPAIVKDMHLRHPDGILIHPANLYWWTYCGDALSGAFTGVGRIYYTMEDITQDVWDDMWKMMFVTQAG
jgi:hypothetical protein